MTPLNVYISYTFFRMRHEYKIQIKALEIFERKKIEHEKCFFGWAKQYNHILLAFI